MNNIIYFLEYYVLQFCTIYLYKIKSNIFGGLGILNRFNPTFTHDFDNGRLLRKVAHI